MSIGEVLSAKPALKAKLGFGAIVTISAATLFVYMLVILERHHLIMQEEDLERSISANDTRLEIEAEAGQEKEQDEHAMPARERMRRLLPSQRIGIACQVSVLILLNYLLLVFLPGSAWLSFIGITSVWVLTLRKVLLDELRRQRLDRIMTLVTLFLFIAGGMTLCTYSRLALKEGQIYQGPARIVGYDDGIYENNDGETLRADLQVEWGGYWGCPETPDKKCTAQVSGAMCSVNYDTDETTGERTYYTADDDIVNEEEYEEEQEEFEEQEEDWVDEEKEYVKEYLDEESEPPSEKAAEDEEMIEEYEEVEEEIEEEEIEYSGDITEEEDLQEEDEELKEMEQVYEQDLTKEEQKEAQKGSTGSSSTTGNNNNSKSNSTHTHNQSETEDAEVKEYEKEEEEYIEEYLDEESEPPSEKAAEDEEAIAEYDQAEEEVKEWETEYTGDDTMEEDLEEADEELEDFKEVYEEDLTKEQQKEKQKGSGTKNKQGSNGDVRQLEATTSSTSEKEVAEQEEADEETVIEEEKEFETEVYNEAADEEKEVEKEYGDEIINEEAAEEDLEAKNEELEKENEELEKENEELKEELKEDQEVEEELDEEIDEVYEYEDDIYESEYWDYDWDSIWGETACEDLFDQDIGSMSFNPDLTPGGDDWPTIQIYGSCNSCSAYIMDYYSTDHFNKIANYQTQARSYFIAGIFSSMAAAFFFLKQYFLPQADNKMELLSDGGVLA